MRNDFGENYKCLLLRIFLPEMFALRMFSVKQTL